MTNRGILERSQQRLRSVRPDYPHVYSVTVGVPAESGWTALDTALGDGTVAAWYEAALRRDAVGGRSTVAAVRVIGSIAHAVLGRLTAALVAGGRAHDCSAANLAVHHDEDGHLDRVAVRRPAVLVLADDPAAGDPDAVVHPDQASLLAAAGAGAVAVLAPVIEQVRELSRFGVVPAWNVAADSVLGMSTFVPLYLGTDERAGRRTGEALLDALVAHGARIRTRGTCEPVLRERAEYLLPVRGSCCFHYKTEPEIEQPGDEYCTTCPLLDAGLRHRRFGNLLDEYVLPARAQAAARG